MIKSACSAQTCAFLPCDRHHDKALANQAIPILLQLPVMPLPGTKLWILADRYPIDDGTGPKREAADSCHCTVALLLVQPCGNVEGNCIRNSYKVPVA